MEDPSVQGVPGAGFVARNGLETADEQGLVRCVVLTTPGAQAGPADLVRALRRKQLALQLAANPFEAMAHLVRTLGDEIPAARRGMALVIVEPTEQPDSTLHGMLAALGRYAPLTTLWAYDKNASPRLHSYVPGDGDASAQRESAAEIVVIQGIGKQTIEASKQRHAHAAPEPTLRLTGEGEIPASLGDEDGLDDSIDPASVMSADELAMLLDDEDAPR